jgi:hypothetical protein
MPDRQIAEVHVLPAVTHSCGRAVQFYEKDSALVEAIGQHVGAAVEAGDTAIIVATKGHREGLAEELRLRKIDTAAAIKAGRFIELDAAEALAKFMVGGGPDKDKFESTIGAFGESGRSQPRTGMPPCCLWGNGRHFVG